MEEEVFPSFFFFFQLNTNFDKISDRQQKK